MRSRIVEGLSKDTPNVLVRMGIQIGAPKVSNNLPFSLDSLGLQGHHKMDFKAKLKPDAAVAGKLLDNNLNMVSAAPRALPGSGPMTKDVLKAYQDDLVNTSILLLLVLPMALKIPKRYNCRGARAS